MLDTAELEIAELSTGELEETATVGAEEEIMAVAEEELNDEVGTKVELALLATALDEASTEDSVDEGKMTRRVC